MDDLQIESERIRDGRQRVAVTGQLDVQGARRVEWVLLKTLRNGATDVLVDVTNCNFVDSKALDVMLSARLAQFRTRLFPVASDRNILQLLQWQAGAQESRHG